MRLGVVGYGRMGSSLVRGALRSGLLKPEDIMVVDLDKGRKAAAIKENLMVVAGPTDLAGVDAIILSVKPKDFPGVMKQIREALDPTLPLFISIAAGIRLATLEEGLGKGARIARVMPNLPASVNEAASAYVMNKHASNKDRHFVVRLLSGVGKAFELEEEDLLDAVTGLSGSGPAYFFLLLGAMETAGIKAGLPRKLARSLAAQTCRGSGTLALMSDLSMEELIRAVASPGGTTEEALKVLESRGFSSAVTDAIVAAIEKSRRMA